MPTHSHPTIPLRTLAFLLLPSLSLSQFFFIEGEDICTDLQNTATASAVHHFCLMTDSNPFAFTTIPGCQEAVTFITGTASPTDTASASSVINRCFCSMLLGDHASCIEPICRGTQFAEYTSSVSSRYCTDANDTDDDDDSTTITITTGRPTPRPSSVPPNTSEEGSAPSTTTPPPTSRTPNGSGSGSAQTTSSSSALAGQMVAPMVGGGVLGCLLGFVALVL